jgi:hypothetical protein
LFNWFLRYVLLRGLPPDVVAACAAHPEIRALLLFRFTYLFAFHAPVLIPLLERLTGHRDPALGVLSLGIASLTMVLADVPTGLYADRNGAKAALRLGLKLTCAIMLGFFLLGLWRAWAVSQGHSAGPFVPGIVGLLLLEAGIGVSLALLSGADTVFFLAVARRSAIPGLQHSGFEGIGSAIRYVGTLVAVVLGAALYDGAARIASIPALRVALQSCLFLLTLLSMAFALRTLNKIPDHPEESGASHPLLRPGFHSIAQALTVLWQWPRFFWPMWLLCLTSSVSLFSVYVLQSPLSRLTASLVRQSSLWWPLYTVLAAVGYWASSRGSHAWRRQHLSSAGSRPESSTPSRANTLWLVAGAVCVLLLYPGAFSLRLHVAEGHWPLLSAAALMCLLFNYLRGFVEPYSATALIAFTKDHGLSVPVSLVSVFNSIKRGLHFALSALFFVLLQRSDHATSHPDATLSAVLLWLALALVLLVLPALRHTIPRDRVR